MFFTFGQNNSGGYFIENDDVRQYLIVEANSSDEAIDKMLDITENYSEYCPCCGERWSTYDVEYGEGDLVPSIWGEPITAISKSPYKENCIVYYNNGEKEIVEFD